jgi:hypothetical protein
LKFTLFDLPRKGVLSHALKPGKLGFGYASEAFDVVDMITTFGKFILAISTSPRLC